MTHIKVMKQALEALEEAHYKMEHYQDEEKREQAITALQSIISQDALDKKAENARELGLNYDTPLSSFVRSSDEAKAEVMERVIDKATEEQKAVIGCVNHDCDQCKAVQEPVGDWVWSWLMDWCKRNGIAPATQDGLFAMVKDARGKFESAPPAAAVQEPVAVVSGYYGGQCVILPTDPARLFNSGTAFYTTPPIVATPLAAQQKPWVGLADEELYAVRGTMSPEEIARAIEAILKEKNT
jgi:hypothetical protein